MSKDTSTSGWSQASAFLGAVAALITAVAAIMAFLPADPSEADVSVHFNPLGKGGCRDTTGGHGEYKIVRNLSESECMARCLEVVGCTGIEWSSMSHNCEIHFDQVLRLSDGGTGPTICWERIR